MSSIDSLIQEKGFLITAHRGQWGGNIVQNTLESAQIAWRSGADILELDVEASTDGVFYCFHTNVEEDVVGQKVDFSKMTWQEIQSFDTINSLRAASGYPIQSLQTMLEGAPQAMYLQIDRCYLYLVNLLAYLDQFPLDIRQRVIIKIPYDLKAMEMLNAHPFKYATMLIIDASNQFKMLSHYQDVNWLGIEVLAQSDQSDTYGPEFIERIHQAGLWVQVNAIRLSKDRDLYAGYDDDISLLDHPHQGWGKLISYGADIIQTDWVMALNTYRREISPQNGTSIYRQTD